MKSTIISITTLVVALSAFAGIRYLGNQSGPTLDKASYVRVAQKSCVKEATGYDAITPEQAESYCKCVLDEVYAGKSVKEMQQMDAEVVNGALPEKYDAVILECAGRLQ